MFNKILNLYNFFDKKHKLKLLYTQLLMLISSFFEILSIFAIGPLIQILNNPDIINDPDELISKIYFFFNFESFEVFLIILVLSIFSFLLLSTLVLVSTIYILSLFSQHLGNILRGDLFKFYISQNWLYHSRSNSSEYIEKAFYEVSRVTNNIILPILVTNSKLLTGILIIVSLTIYNPLVSIICFLLFGTIYGIVFKLVKTKITEYGINQGNYMRLMYRVMNESFVGIKEAILYGNQKKYHEKFFKTGDRYANVMGKVQFLASAPKYALEFIAFTIILFFILFLIYFNQTNFNENLPTLAIFVFAGYKLLPIFQAIYLGLVQIKNNIPAYDAIENELFKSKNFSINKYKEDGEIIKLKNHEALILKNVSFSYTESTKQTIRDINIDIKKNSLNFIIGPSGSGKSTILDLILGLIYPRKGSIFIGKNQLNNETAKLWHKNIGYVGQNIFLLDDTIKNNISFADDDNEIDEERLKKALKLSDVENFLHSLPDGVDTFVGERGLKLSGGQRQRVAIARALYLEKDFLIFDEATASLDGIAEKFIIDQLRNLAKTNTVVMVTHNVKLCKNADKIYLLENGFVKASGTYEHIKNDSLFVGLLNDS